MNVNNPWPQTYQAGIVRQAYDAGNYVTEGTGVDFARRHQPRDGQGRGRRLRRQRLLRPQEGQGAPPRPARDDPRADLPGRSPRASPGTLYGEPIAFVSNGPWVNNYELIAGDRSMAILGVRQDFTSRSSPRASSDGSGASS
jgi:hypothetical protein